MRGAKQSCARNRYVMHQSLHGAVLTQSKVSLLPCWHCQGRIGGPGTRSDGTSGNNRVANCYISYQDCTSNDITCFTREQKNMHVMVRSALVEAKITIECAVFCRLLDSHGPYPTLQPTTAKLISKSFKAGNDSLGSIAIAIYLPIPRV